MTERWVTIKGENGPEHVNMAHVRHIKRAHGNDRKLFCGSWCNKALLIFGSDTDANEAFLFVLEPPEHFLPKTNEETA